MPGVFYTRLFLTVCWFLFMTFLSHQDGEHTRETSRELADLFGGILRGVDIGILNSFLRRAAHVVVFAVLTILSAATLEAGAMWEYRFLVLALLFLWSWADEATKPLIQGRHFDWKDVGLNAAGILIGMVFCEAVRILIF